MRELTKSIFRASWAMPLFGLEQAARLAFPQSQSLQGVASSLDAVSEAAERQMSDGTRRVYETGDRLQRSAVDAAFSLGLDLFDPTRWLDAMPGCGGRAANGRAANGGNSATGEPSGASTATSAASAGAAPAGWGPIPS